MNVTSDLRLRRFILAGTMLAVCLSLTFSTTGGSVASPGPICNNPASIRQCGFGQCTINVGLSSCSISVSFSPAFAIKPRLDPVWNGSALTVQANVFLPDHDELLVFEAYNSTTWRNMPTTDAPTEIYGQSNQRLNQEIPLGGNSLAGDFCVDVVEPSQNNTATLTAQAFYSGSWHDLGTDANFYANVGNAAGTNCGQFEALSNSLVTGSPIDYRVVGRDGAAGALCSPICIPTCSQDNVGAGFAVNIDCPQFGTIWLILSYLQPSASVTVTCQLAVVALTTSTATIAIQCGAAAITGVTGKAYWTATE